MKFVFEQFAVNNYDLPQYRRYETKNVVIHSRPVDGVAIIEDVYVMDFNNFILPFDRGIFWKEYVKDPDLKYIFQGRITINKMFDFYNSKFYLYNYRDCILDYKKIQKVGDIKIEIEDFIIKEVYNDEFLNHEKRCVNTLALMRRGLSIEKAEEMAKKL